MTKPLTDRKIAEKLKWYDDIMITAAQHLEEQEPFSEEEKAFFWEMIEKIEEQITKDKKLEESGNDYSEFVNVLNAVQKKLPAKNTDEDKYIGQTYGAYAEFSKVYGYQRKQKMLES